MFRLILLIGLITPALGNAEPNCFFFPTFWQRTGDPVLRDPVVGENYEVASDAHVIVGPEGGFHMFYSGDDGGKNAIKYAAGSQIDTWQRRKTVLGRSADHATPVSMETPFYRLSETGEHQIYFIGYPDEATYEAEVYLAIAPQVDGPYIILDNPVIPRGVLGGKDVHLITSPSVVMHEGLLHIAFLGWDAFENVSQVWVLGGTSTDDGRTWDNIREIDAPIGMEGQITPLPDGGFVATRTTEFDGDEGIGIACAAHPFGPYDLRDEADMTRAGPPWEVDEITAPQITFDPFSGEANLFYTGADHARGWWIMRALPTY